MINSFHNFTLEDLLTTYAKKLSKWRGILSLFFYFPERNFKQEIDIANLIKTSNKTVFAEIMKLELLSEKQRSDYVISLTLKIYDKRETNSIT